MNPSQKLKIAFLNELKAAHVAKNESRSFEEWKHLERAHILGQYQALRHFWVHCLMIVFSVRHKDIYEFLGQIPRIVLAIPGSLTHLAPRGNTGGADVGIFQVMSIPKDLEAHFQNKL